MHGGDVLDQNRSARAGGADNDILNIREIRYESFPANNGLLFRTFEIGSSGVGVVLLQCLNHRSEWYVVSGELVAIDLYLVGLQFASMRVHLDNSRNGPELRSDLPVKDAAQVHQGRRAGYLELIDFAQSGRNRPHFRRAKSEWNILT